MNATKGLRPISHLITGVAVALAATASFGSDHALDVGGFLSSKGLNSTDIQSVVGFSSRTDVSWLYGHTNEVKPAYVQIKPEGSAGGTADTWLSVEYNPILLQPVKVSGCTHSMGVSPNCSDLNAEVVSNDGTVRFSVDANTWLLKIAEAPCVSGLSCQFRIHSWGLEMRRQFASGNLKSFPRIAGVLQYNGGIAIFNGERNELWLDLGIPQVVPGSTLVSAGLSAEGRLVLRYDSGSFVLDFEKDSFYQVDASGFYAATNGIGGFDQSTFTAIINKPSSSGSFLAGDDSLVIWENGHMNLNLGASEFSAMASPFQESVWPISKARLSYDETGDISASMLRIESDRLVIDTFNPESKSFAEAKVPASGETLPSTTSLMLSGKGAFRLSGSGAEILEGSVFLPTSLSFDGQQVALLDDGSAFVQHNDAAGCRWLHYKQHAEVAKSFKESGHSLGCNGSTSFSNSFSGTTAISRSGTNVTISSFTH